MTLTTPMLTGQRSNEGYTQMKIIIIIIIGLLTLGCSAADAHCYTDWRYPSGWTGRCGGPIHPPGMHYVRKYVAPARANWYVEVKPEPDLLPPGYKVIWKPGDPVADPTKDLTSKLKELGKQRELDK